MQHLGGLRAEWALLRIRLLRTRLGLWLVALGIGLLWLERAAPRLDPLTASLQGGALAAVLCVGYLAGSGADRSALTLSLSHPAAPAVVALGRWAAALGGAGLVVLAVAVHSVWTRGAVAWAVADALAGLVAAAAVCACSLALVWTGGNVPAALFFVFLALLGNAPPEAMVGMPRPGVARMALAALLEVAPTAWRYRGISAGDPGALLHAASWIGLGLAVARLQAERLLRSGR